MHVRSLAGLTAVLCLGGIGAAQSSLFVPTGAGATEGPSSTGWPWNLNASAVRIQYIYDSTHFTGQGVAFPILITGARWRANATTSTWAGTTYSNVEVSASTSAVNYTAATATFASNRGGDFAQVYNGSVNFVGGTGNGTGVIGPNVVDVSFGSPFLYDPTSGNDFLTEVSFAANSWSGGGTTALDAVTTNSLATRVYNITSNTSLTGTVQQNVGLVMELLYNPASGLYANFNATPTSGATPLNVNFTDATFTSDPGGITSWAWDLNGDNIVDSNAQNPSFTYTVCGPYNVTLTVTDSQHPSSTLTKSNFIFADPQLVVTANFAASANAGAAPFTVNFTDTSAGNPTAWSWDFNGDSIIDSTVQNPSFTYNTPGFYNVTLNAANACFTDGETKTNFIQVLGATQNTVSADKLEYQFNEVRGNTVANVASTTLYPATGSMANSVWQRDPNRPLFKGNEAGFGCMSYSATNANWVNAGSTFSHTGSLTVMWWARRDPLSTTTSPFGYFFGDGSFRCFMGSAGILFGGGTGTPLSATLTANFSGHLQQGAWHHYAVVIDDAAGFNTIYEDGVPHAGRSYAAGTYTYTGTTGFAVGAISAASGGSRASLHYDMDDFRMYSRALTQTEIQNALVHENPTGALMEDGCTDSNSFTPRLTAVGAPQIGNLNFGLLASGLEPGRPTAVYVGLSASLGGFLPFDLSGTGIFGPGCRLLVSPDIILNFGSGGGSVFLPAPIPIDPTLQGGHTYNQLLSLGSGPLSAVSNAIDTQMQF
ncbi:MAG: PKD domain-containing protein [Planctomycetes bacterium]|nr:PKD domain-containing protein [Planctomycetota bacterium]